MREDRLIVGYESALDFWRATRAAASVQHVLEPSGRTYGALRPPLSERASRVLALCGGEAPLDLSPLLMLPGFVDMPPRPVCWVFAAPAAPVPLSILLCLALTLPERPTRQSFCLSEGGEEAWELRGSR